MKVSRPGGDRNYRGEISGLDNVQINFLSASEIAGQIASGEIHLGVTGEDLIREEIGDISQIAHLVMPLGFGHANVVIAVPAAWIDVRTMSDLYDVAAIFAQQKDQFLRVATKYVKLTHRYFEKHHIADYRIVKSLGATEGAPAAGQAECIVDITSTGSTLKANNLRILQDGEMLKSEANLVASLRASWTNDQKLSVKQVLGRLSARQTAKKYDLVSLYPINQIVEDKENTALIHDVNRLGGVFLSKGQTGAYTIKISKKNSVILCEALSMHDIGPVVISNPHMLMETENSLYESFDASLI